MDKQGVIQVSLNFNRFVDQNKEIIGSEKFKILEDTPQHIRFLSQLYNIGIKINADVYQINENHYQTFIFDSRDLQYEVEQESVGQSHQQQKKEIDCVYGLSIKKTERIDDEEYQSFIDVIQNSCRVKDLKIKEEDQCKDKVYKKIIEHCPFFKKGSQQLGTGISDKQGTVFSSFFSKITSVFDKPSKSSKSSQPSQPSKAQKEQKQKQPPPTSPPIPNKQEEYTWDMFKGQCQNLNNLMTEKIKPLNNKLKEVSDDIGDKFDQSENDVIRKVRKWSKQAESMINDKYYGESKEQRMESVRRKSKTVQNKLCQQLQVRQQPYDEKEKSEEVGKFEKIQQMAQQLLEKRQVSQQLLEKKQEQNETSKQPEKLDQQALTSSQQLKRNTEKISNKHPQQQLTSPQSQLQSPQRINSGQSPLR